MSDNPGTPIHDPLKSMVGGAKQRPADLAHPPAEILEELGENEEEYDDLSEEQDEEGGGYEDESEGSDEEDEQEGPGPSLTHLLVGDDATNEQDVDKDEDDGEYAEPPPSSERAKRLREEDEGAQEAGDEKDGYVTDVNEEGEGPSAKVKKAKLT